MITIPKGSKIGIHSLLSASMAIPLAKLMAQRGVFPSLIKGVDNGGTAIDAKKISASILTITRKVNLAEDSAQFISDGQRDSVTMKLHARAAVDYPTKGLGNARPLNPDELAAADWLEVINEADPPGIDGWKAFGEYLCEMVTYASNVGVPLALPATNSGTPEWAEMQALASSGIFKLMKDSWSDPRLKHGHIWTAHEGVLAGITTQAFGSIPGAPDIPNAGPLCWRYRFLYSLLKDRGEIVPLVVSEFYAAGGYNPSNVDAALAAMTQYDEEIRKDEYVLAVLPFTLGGLGTNWSQQDYTYLYPKLIDHMVAVKDFSNGSSTTPVPHPLPPPPTITTNKCLVGVHGRADGALQPADLIAIKESGVEAVKLMSTANAQDVDALKAINPNIFLVVRLFTDFNNRNIQPQQFVQDIMPDIMKFYNKGVRYFEVHNEPNLLVEGLSSSWNSGSEFGNWFSQVSSLIKAQLPDTKLGFPGLSPGNQIGNIRMDEEVFLRGATPAALGADWVGVHCYFQDQSEMALNIGGLNYQLYQQLLPGKTLLITEFSNPNPAQSASTKADQYVKYYRSLRNLSNVGAAFCYVLSGTAWQSEAWRLENGTQTTIPATIGAYMNTPIGTANTHTVMATALNVREFPWTGAVQPPKNGLLQGGSQVKVFATIILPGMLFGWGCISQDGNQWVSMQWLKPI